MMESHFSAGIAKVDISPSQADIDAYRTLGKEQFKSLKQKLYARVIAFRDDRTGRISIILGSDLINVPDYFMIRQRLAEKFGIKPTDMILGGTQNHASIVSDPPDFKPDERPDILLHVRDEIHNGIEKAVGIALSDMKKAVLGFGTTPSVIGVNKDETLKEGRPSGANLNMQEDHDLFILLVKDLEGRPMAAMLNYGMQGVYYSTMTDSYISGDIHGAVSEKLESFYGEDFIAPYLIGASGDKNPVLNALPQVFHFKDGVMTKETLPMPDEAQDRMLDWLSGLQANDAVTKIASMKCDITDLEIRSDEMFTEADARPLPLRSGGGIENDSRIVGKVTHRIHYLALCKELSFGCGNSITMSALGKLVKQSLPCTCVYISVEGGIIGYVVDHAARPETFGYRYCSCHNPYETERIYVESVRTMYRDAT